jgi:sarcosine oxidase subunit alpha
MKDTPSPIPLPQGEGRSHGGALKALRIPNRHRGRRISIHVDGQRVAAYFGETVFAALLAAGIHTLRHPFKDSTETARGGFCGMGVCQECRVTIDGRPDERACMTEVREGMEIFTDGR